MCLRLRSLPTKRHLRGGDFGAILPISGAGIESITVGEPTIEAIYNLEGKRMNNMSRGLNILRMSDGTTKKVLNLREK